MSGDFCFAISLIDTQFVDPVNIVLDYVLEVTPLRTWLFVVEHRWLELNDGLCGGL